MRNFNVAVVGATGAVGCEVPSLLEGRGFPICSLKFFGRPHPEQRSMKAWRDGVPVDVPIRALEPGCFEGTDYAIFSAGADVSRQWAPAAVKEGCVVIDNSSAFRMDPEVPLVVPEVNPEESKKHKGIVANPNCSTIIMLVAVYPLHRANPVKRIIVSTYQAASGAGAWAMKELEAQTAEVLQGRREVTIAALPQRLAFNLFPHVDTFLGNGYTKEEMKFVHESRKIVGYPSLMISATCVRVPVFRAHSEAVNIEFTVPMTPGKVREILSKAPGVKVVDDPDNNKYPMPIDASGQWDCLVGRIRQDVSRDDGRGIELFISGDQLLKGAALNAVQIMELLIQSRP